MLVRNIISKNAGGGLDVEGGTYSESGVYGIHKFTTSGTFTVNSNPDELAMDILVVGGGGGGQHGESYSGSGGGGAGAFRVNASQTVVANTYTITVGAGGTGGSSDAADGGDSIFPGITADGGCRGGKIYVTLTYSGNGSGGGGGEGGNGADGGTYGNDGTDGMWEGGGGTGGGAGGTGATPEWEEPGTAAPGTANSYSGVSYTYGIGAPMRYSNAGTNGRVNSGDGGQGGMNTGWSGFTGAGDNGGSGIVIIRYVLP